MTRFMEFMNKNLEDAIVSDIKSEMRIDKKHSADNFAMSLMLQGELPAIIRSISNLIDYKHE